MADFGTLETFIQIRYFIRAENIFVEVVMNSLETLAKFKEHATACLLKRFNELSAENQQLVLLSFRKHWEACQANKCLISTDIIRETISSARKGTLAGDLDIAYSVSEDTTAPGLLKGSFQFRGKFARTSTSGRGLSVRASSLAPGNQYI